MNFIYKNLSSILLSGLCPYVDKIIEDHQCGFRPNIKYWSDFLHSSDTGEKERSTMYNERVHKFLDMKACDSVRRGVLYNLVEFWVRMKRSAY
jgi:hypothetical protein